MRDKIAFTVRLLALMVAFCAVGRVWADTETVDGITWTYTVNNGKASLGGGSSSSRAISTSIAGAITIPSTLGGYPVTSIGEWAFYNCSGLTSVTIPNSVTSIGDEAFCGCSGLTSVTIPGSVTSIGKLAFHNCSGLTSVAIPNSVTSIWSGAFLGCSGLTRVTIPDSVTSIGQSAFSGCSGLASVTIPDSVTSIGKMAFYNCSGLTSVTIPNSVTSIGGEAFYNCSGLMSVTIPNSVTSIGDRAFLRCSGLTSVTIPSGVTSIEFAAFSNCSGLASVSIPDSVTSIGRHAFYDCSSLTSVTIPNSVTSIGDGAFEGCSGLTSVTIGSGVTSIGERAFYDCSGLTRVTIPDSVTSIGRNAFQGCSGLTSVTIGSGVTSIGSYAFSGCSRLTSVMILGNVTSIGDYPFYNCSGLTRVIFMAETPPRGINNLISYNKVKVWYPIKSADLYRQVVAESEFGGYCDLALGCYAGLINYELSTGEECPWRADLLASHDGSDSICSGTITHNEESWVEMIVSGAGSLSFWWKASSEYDGDWVLDYCYLSIDGEVKGFRTDGYALEGIAIGGASDWQKVVVNIEGDGLHTVRWTYKKDDVDEGDIGEDCAWLDEVYFAEWISVSFNIGEGVGSAPEVISELRGTIITLPAQAGFNRADYTFVGWSDGVKTYMPGESYTVTDSGVKFTAVWQRNEISVSISSADVANGGTIDTQGATITISAVATPAGGTPEIYYTLDGTAPTTNSLLYDGPFEANALSVTVKAFAVMENYFDSDVVEFSFTRRPYSLDECINVAGCVVSSGGNAVWSRALDETHDGVAALRSGTIGHSQSVWVEMAVNGAGELSFWGKISSQNKVRANKHDYLSVSVDGTETETLGGGEIDWTNMVVSVEGDGEHKIRWAYVKDGDEKLSGYDCAWLDEVVWTPSGPVIEGDDGANITGDSEKGYTVIPSDSNKDVVVTIPEGVEPKKVTVEVAATVETVKANGAKVKVMKGGYDIAEHLNLDAVTQGGVINLANAQVKEEVVKEALDTAKGATVSLGNTESPTLTTAVTKSGLTYTLQEGTTLEGMKDGDSKLGDGTAWTPKITVKGGTSGFYTIKVEK